MDNLSSIDLVVIIAYMAVLIGLGMYLKKRASASLEDYLIGGRNIRWWALGISGIASWVDVTGTMIIVSWLYMLGPRGLFIEFRGGVGLPLAMMMIFTGKWHRRSNCLTGAQWMIYRFGKDKGGQFARFITALATIVGTIGMLAYLIKGAGLFFSMFLPYSPLTCAIIIVAIGTFYTMISGFYGVVYTDVFQSIIILIAVIFVTTFAVMKSANTDLGKLALEVTGNPDWLSSKLHVYTYLPERFMAERHLALFSFFYFLRNVVGGLGTGADPRFFGAQSERACGKIGFMWGWLMICRWPMMMGFAILGLIMVKDMFPSQDIILNSVAIIKTHIPGILETKWPAVISDITQNPGNYPSEMMTQLQTLLGSNWVDKLKMTSFSGCVDSERILPSVILFSIPACFRGLLIVALLAAAMTTFSSTVNMTSGFFSQDIYQAFIRPKASQKELIYASWIFIVVLVVLGFLMANSVRSINDIWNWVIMGLGGGFFIPSIMRMYWWRFNSGGYAIGTLVGMIAALAQRYFFPELTAPVQFVTIAIIGLVGTVLGTLLTKPTDEETLSHFYVTTRPFGLWKPLKKYLQEGMQEKMAKEHKNDIIAIPFALGWMISLYMIPLQLLVRNYVGFSANLAILIVCLLGLYQFWYKNLPE